MKFKYSSITYFFADWSILVFNWCVASFIKCFSNFCFFVVGNKPFPGQLWISKWLSQATSGEEKEGEKVGEKTEITRWESRDDERRARGAPAFRGRPKPTRGSGIQLNIFSMIQVSEVMVLNLVSLKYQSAACSHVLKRNEFRILTIHRDSSFRIKRGRRRS